MGWIGKERSTSFSSLPLCRDDLCNKEVSIAIRPVSNKTAKREPQHVPDAPESSAPTARDGMESARSLARRYRVDCVRFHAGVASHPTSEAPLYTKTLNTRSIEEIAGAIPQAVPAAPPPLDAEAGDGREPS
jgi:hypothetical protein